MKTGVISHVISLSRSDRKDDGLRRMFMKTGVISHAKGSSYLEVGDTKVKR